MSLHTEEFGRLAPFHQLVEVVATLRGEEGCPWDRAQDHHSLKRYLQEETHEVLEALEGDDPAHLEEELGDLLFQVVFHARLAEEAGRFDADDVCRGIVGKMVRRHPHVFGDAPGGSPEQVARQWEQGKLQESGGRRTSLLDGIPRELPALLRAQRVASRAAEMGFAWPDHEAAMGKVREEFQELQGALRASEASRVEEEVGDLIFAVTTLASMSGVDAEAALRGSLRRFAGRFRDLEDRLGGSLEGLEAGELLLRWRETRRSSGEDS